MGTYEQIKADFLEALKPKEGVKGYDTEAEVVRIDGSTAWVHIPGGVDETPVAMTVNAKAGDSVRVRVSGGSAWITGSDSAPPTDDRVANIAHTIANEAQTKAETAETRAVSAEVMATAAKQIAGDTAQHFWFTETGTDTGAHITEVTQEEFEADPTLGGANLLARSNGIAVRDGLTELATFGNSGAVIGQNANGKSRTDIGTGGMRVIKKKNGVDIEVANLGYGEGKNASGGISEAPYATLGLRSNGSTIGNYSVSEGHDTEASGFASHAEGTMTVAASANQHVFGEYNVIDDAGLYTEIVGGQHIEPEPGDLIPRANIRTLDRRGNEWLAGKLTLGEQPTANMDAATKKYVDDLLPWSQAEAGSEAFSAIASGSTTTINVSFTKAFTGEPRIVLGMKGGSAAGATQLQVGYHNASASGFTIDVRNRGSSGYNGRVSWFAFL